jgi:hypothetical protein
LIWTLAKHRNGLERPHFVATETVAVAPAQGTAKAAVPHVFCPCLVRPKRNKEERRTHVDNQQTPEMVKRDYELQEPIAVAVEKYAAFIASTPDYVVNSALVLRRDADLRRWRKQQQPSSDKKDGHAAAKAART